MQTLRARRKNKILKIVIYLMASIIFCIVSVYLGLYLIRGEYKEVGKLSFRIVPYELTQIEKLNELEENYSYIEASKDFRCFIENVQNINTNCTLSSSNKTYGQYIAHVLLNEPGDKGRVYFYTHINKKETLIKHYGYVGDALFSSLKEIEVSNTNPGWLANKFVIENKMPLYMAFKATKDREYQHIPITPAQIESIKRYHVLILPKI